MEPYWGGEINVEMSVRQVQLPGRRDAPPGEAVGSVLPTCGAFAMSGSVPRADLNPPCRSNDVPSQALQGVGAHRRSAQATTDLTTWVSLEHRRTDGDRAGSHRSTPPAGSRRRQPADQCAYPVTQRRGRCQRWSGRQPTVRCSSATRSTEYPRSATPPAPANRAWFDGSSRLDPPLAHRGASQAMNLAADRRAQIDAPPTGSVGTRVAARGHAYSTAVTVSSSIRRARKTGICSAFARSAKDRTRRGGEPIGTQDPGCGGELPRTDGDGAVPPRCTQPKSASSTTIACVVARGSSGVAHNVSERVCDAQGWRIEASIGRPEP